MNNDQETRITAATDGLADILADLGIGDDIGDKGE